jgi:hypothetical protein
MNAHQGKFLSSLVGLGVSVLVGMIGVTLGGFQFLTGSTFFTFFLTTAFGSSATSCTAFSEDDIISNVEHPLKNRMDVSSNALVVTSLIKYTDEH